MKELKKLSLKKELDREARKIEEEVGKRQDLDDLTVSEDMETSLFNKIQDYEYDKRFTRTVRRGRKRRRIILAVAAVLILIFGSVITGTGSKSYLKVLMERIAGKENLTNIDVENMESQSTEDLDVVYIFDRIRDETGISPVHFGYMPENMYLKEYEIDGEQGRAVLLYKYNDNIVRYRMYMNDADSSHGWTDMDELTDEYPVTLENGVQVTVQEYEVDSQENPRYVADFEYRDAQYQLMGHMEKDEFEKIIKNLRFYD